MADHNEVVFETEICEHLAANGWLYSASDAGYELPVVVEVTNATGEPVFSARISMWLSPLRPSVHEAGNA